MELLFIHNLLYTMHWRKFASAAISNWQESSLLVRCIQQMSMTMYLLCLQIKSAGLLVLVKYYIVEICMNILTINCSANAGFLVISRGFISTSTGLASTILSTSALLSGVTLLQWYSGAVDMNAVTVVCLKLLIDIIQFN